MSARKRVAGGKVLPEGLLVALKEAQSEHGYLPAKVMVELAGAHSVPPNAVYGVATFYSFLTVKPGGRHIIRICKSLPCYLKKYLPILNAIQKEIGIMPGETTPDGRFSFELTNCIGLCDRAPAMLIDDDPHVDLTPGKIAGILRKYK